MTRSNLQHDDVYYMQRIASGDMAAFQHVFDALSGDVLKLSYSLLRDYQVAEDATQEVFIKLWNNAQTWMPTAQLKTWLLKITRNHCLDILRKQQNDLKKNHDLYKEVISMDLDNQAHEIEAHADQRKQKNIIKIALLNLPERQREAITLVYYNEVKNLEAASIMGMQAVAFDSLLARARRTLRSQLKNQSSDLKGYFYET